MILVTGANGRVGRLVVAELLQHHQVHPRIFVRDEARAKARLVDTVEIAIGDLADQPAVDRAMEGIDAVFLCSPVHPNQTRLQGHVVEAASRVGTRIVKLSGLATFAESPVDSGRWHASTEEAIRVAGLGHTFLHPYFFAQNLAFQLPSARDDGVIRSAVRQAAIAMVDVRDIAAVAAKLLVQPGLARDTTLPLTGDRAVTYSEVAGVFAEVLDRPVDFLAQRLDEVEVTLRNSGRPDWHIRILLQFNRAFSQGLAEEVDPAVRDVLGRPPLSLADTLRDAVRQEPKDSDPFPS
ncbi:MAG TPA: NAD(P)H-binding protein [Candidatus Latescibacteria bacterium]|jgi:uncharacterized protein YbjT (DUF2867 family)|nr:hypothetical protein [Gemmatimonadaceae bacterium]MDP6019093.1 NAD(P)H-binding protein [Candidatus Latescibacterota bacterium]HJP31176.1 NAD(P)H-binding protein [Candidatus Latescibacterota bacterium]